MKNRRTSWALHFGPGLIACVLSVPVSLHAQSAAPSAEQPEVGSIVVTARKRQEDILKTPLTVTAVTGEALDAKGVVTMQDLAASTPGLNINNNSSGHADRSFQQIILRGFTPSNTLSTTTSLFIDGVPVASPSAFTAISAPERIEILKGPQSAYFGRNTFAGAINVVNKDPSAHWGGEVIGAIGTRNSYRVRGQLEGPILGDDLTFRASIEKFAKDGSWRNQANGETLGDQSSLTGTMLVVAKPTDRLKIKLFALVGMDEDGPAAQTRLIAANINDSNGNVLYRSQSNCTLTGSSTGVQGTGTAVARPYICGTLPMTTNGVSANTAMTPNVNALISSPSGRVVSPGSTVGHYGLLRITQHYHATADYKLNQQISFSLLGGYNKEIWTSLIDLDGFDTRGIQSAAYPSGYFDFPYLVERKTNDWSVEGRMNYDFGKLHGVVGASYLVADQIQGGGSAFSTVSTAAFYPGGKNENKTIGVFVGATYDITSKLSLSAEGRFQNDDIAAYTPAAGLSNASSAYIPAGTYPGGSLIVKRKYNSFTPRIIANYQFGRELMLYASWAKGINPAQFNTGVLSNTAIVQSAARSAGLALAVNPEKLTNYEIGAKGRVGNAITYSVAGYYAQWRNQINAITLTVPDGTVTNGIANVSFITGNANAGTVDLYGVEGEARLRANDLITIDAAGAINLSDIKNFVSPTLSALTGIYDYSGKQMPNTSKYSANIGIQVGHPIAGQPKASWFLRGDYNYKSGFYVNQANLSKTSDSNVFNFRAGATIDHFSLEIYVNNAFNNKAYTSATDNYTFTSNFAYTSAYSAVLVGLPDLRTAGVQAKYKF